MSCLRNFFNKILSNRNIIALLCAFLIFLALYLQDYMPEYSPISWILLLALIVFFKQINLYNDKFFISSILFSTVFSFLLTFGRIVYDNAFQSSTNIWRHLLSFKNIFSFLGLFVLIYAILINVFPILYKYKMKIGKNLNSKKVFILSFLVILLCWIPYFLALFPGNLTIDSVISLETISNNFSYMTNHHSIFYINYISSI